MAKRNSRLKLFIRLDGNGQAIPGSVVERLKQPRQGRWLEIPADPCCDSTTLAYTPSDVDGTDFTLTILCDATPLIVQTVEGTTTTIEELTALLNDKAGYLGSFSTDGTDINFSVKSTVVQDLGCDGTLSFTVVD